MHRNTGNKISTFMKLVTQAQFINSKIVDQTDKIEEGYQLTSTMKLDHKILFKRNCVKEVVTIFCETSMLIIKIVSKTNCFGSYKKCLLGRSKFCDQEAVEFFKIKVKCAKFKVKAPKAI